MKWGKRQVNKRRSGVESLPELLQLEDLHHYDPEVSFLDWPLERSGEKT